MKRRHWKRLFIGWVLVNLLLSAPAAAQYNVVTYPVYTYGSSSSDDDGWDIKPWMLAAGLASNMLSGGVGGCTPGR